MLIFCRNNTIAFDKMQIPFVLLWLRPFHTKLVWRLSEFAVLCACFGGRTFCLCGAKNAAYKKEGYILIFHTHILGGIRNEKNRSAYYRATYYSIFIYL